MIKKEVLCVCFQNPLHLHFLWRIIYECALMSVEFLTLEVCCCDMQAYSDGGGMSLVLASLSSALCI